MTPEQLAALTPVDLDALRVAVLTEQERRRDIESIPAEVERLTARLTRARGGAPPAATRLPGKV